MELEHDGAQPAASPASSTSSMQLEPPNAAAAAALGELGEGQPAVAGAGKPAQAVDVNLLRLELQGLVGTVDWLATDWFGPKMALNKPKDVDDLVDAWMPYCIEQGGVNLPTWLTALVVTAAIYSPRVKATIQERRAAKALGEAQASSRAA